MKKLSFFRTTLLVALFATFCTPRQASAQTMNVMLGNVIYAMPAEKTGNMVFDAGNALTIMNRTFSTDDITRIYVDHSSVDDNTVSVNYDGQEATVIVAGNIASRVDADVNGAHVTITQADDTDEEITYRLSGTSDNGSFCMNGSYKATIEMNNLALTSQQGFAVYINDGKRIDLIVNGQNTLADAADGEQKACFMVKGHTEVKGDGTLTISGNAKHAFKGNEYVELKKTFTGQINVTKAASDGLHIGQYLKMNNGNVTVENCGDDGIQVEVTDDADDELNGQILLQGGTVNVNISAQDTKGIRCDGLFTVSDDLGNNTAVNIVCSSAAYAAKGMKSGGDMNITGGTFNISTAGKGIWDSENLETSACAAIKCAGNMTVSGGTFTMTASGSGGKGISGDGTLNISGGTMTISTTGGLYYNNGSSENTNYTGDTDRVADNYTTSAKGIKADGNIHITGGDITITTKGNNAEGMETKGVLTIDDGTVNVSAYDDAINSKGEMYLNGGNVTAVAANNDAIDSNANLHITGGTVIACGANSPECGLDAAEHYYLYITGGNVLAIGGGNNAVTATTGSQPVLATSGNVSGGNTVSVKSGNTVLATFTVPTTYTGSSSGQGGGWPGGPGGPGGGGQGKSILVSCAGLTQGTSYTVTYGSSSSSATASTSYNGGGGYGPGW